MNICFVQPNTDYKVKEHQHSLALTFPQLVNDLGVSCSNYSIYIDGLSIESLLDHLESHKTTHVFITCNTSTFPRSTSIAQLCKKNGYKTVLGGIFATSNSTAIGHNFREFDFVVSGKPNKKLLDSIKTSSAKPAILKFNEYNHVDVPLNPTICSDKFYDIYHSKSVCYEITNGCIYNCTYCSLRSAWGSNNVNTKSFKTVNYDLKYISKKWNRLKIIDDDILQSFDIIKKLRLRDNFTEIICSTRVDRINSQTIALLKEIGITHIILGVESFDKNFILSTNKSNNNQWIKFVNNAISLCIENSIIPRPVLMLLSPGMHKKYLTELKEYISDWKISNGVEVFFSFFTPHPGLKIKTLYSGLITNDLSYFDHLNIIYCPSSLNKNNLYKVVEEYHLLVKHTQSKKFNPTINIHNEFLEKYECFFKNAQQWYSADPKQRGFPHDLGRLS